MFPYHMPMYGLGIDHMRLQKLESQKMNVSKQLHYNLSESCRAYSFTAAVFFNQQKPL